MKLTKLPYGKTTPNDKTNQWNEKIQQMEGKREGNETVEIKLLTMTMMLMIIRVGLVWWDSAAADFDKRSWQTT